MITAFLNKPFPYFATLKKTLLTYLGIGTFVAVFLIIFQPFDINLWATPHKTLKLIGFGLVSFLVPSLIHLAVRSLFPASAGDEGWTVWKEIGMILLVLVGIAFGNLFYGMLLGIAPLSFAAFLSACAATFLLGVFPVTAYVIVKHNSLLRLNLQQSLVLNRQLAQQTAQEETLQPEATPASEKKEELILLAENGKDEFRVATALLLFIEAADNYSGIVFLENGTKKKHLLRSSLKRIESQITDNALVRCHRACLVNLDQVKRVEGNAAGYKLYLNGCHEPVPVSRQYISVVNERLQNLK